MERINKIEINTHWEVRHVDTDTKVPHSPAIMPNREGARNVMRFLKEYPEYYTDVHLYKVSTILADGHPIVSNYEKKR